MQDPDHPRPSFEPQVAVFLCDKCCHDPPDWAGAARPPFLSQLHHRCATEVGAAELRRALAAGADGVLVLGCLMAECLNGPGHVKALQSIYRNQHLMSEMDLAPQRLRQEWVAPCEAAKVVSVLDEFRAVLRDLGPAAATGVRRMAQKG